MHVQQIDFDRIRLGTKTVEMRVLDEKRKALKVGDEVPFVRWRGNVTLRKKIVWLKVYSTFAMALQDNDNWKKAWHASYQEALDILKSYYTEEEERQSWVIAITIK